MLAAYLSYHYYSSYSTNIKKACQLHKWTNWSCIRVNPTIWYESISKKIKAEQILHILQADLNRCTLILHSWWEKSMFVLVKHTFMSHFWNSKFWQHGQGPQCFPYIVLVHNTNITSYIKPCYNLPNFLPIYTAESLTMNLLQ